MAINKIENNKKVNKKLQSKVERLKVVGSIIGIMRVF